MDFHKKIANALSAAKKAAGGKGYHIIASSKLSRGDRELLLKEGWIRLIHRGWYLLVNKDVFNEGDTTPLYGSLWEYVEKVSRKNLGKDYWLTADQAINLHAQNNSFPRQIIINTSASYYNKIEIDNDTDILFITNKKPPKKEEVFLGDFGLRMLSIESSLSRLSPVLLENPTAEVKALLQNIKDEGAFVKYMLDNASVASAEKMASILMSLDESDKAKSLVRAFSLIGKEVRIDVNSAAQKSQPKNRSIMYLRISALFQNLSEKLKKDHTLPFFQENDFYNTDFLVIEEEIKAQYVYDAYNSLSIENYQVSEGMIKKIRDGNWNPKTNSDDYSTLSGMAAKGYQRAYKSVIDDLKNIHRNKNPVEVCKKGFQQWREDLFSEAVKAGVIEVKNIFGYRNTGVSIRASRHVPPAKEKIMDAMEALFDSMKEEKNHWVRAVLAHALFVHIHPYSDGNGRTARFLMNTLLVSSGFPWISIKQEDRSRYFASLEDIHINKNPLSLHFFLEEELKKIKDSKVPDFGFELRFSSNDVTWKEDVDVHHNSSPANLCKNASKCKNPNGVTKLRGKRKEIGVCSYCEPQILNSSAQ